MHVRIGRRAMVGRTWRSLVFGLTFGPQISIHNNKEIDLVAQLVEQQTFNP